MKKTGLVTALLMFASVAVAQPPERGEGRGRGEGPEAAIDRVMNFDENKDGKLSKDEVPERLQSMFGRADKNEDGQLTREEIIADFRSREGGDRRGPGRDGGRPPRDGERPRDGEGPPRDGDRPRDGGGPPREGGFRGGPGMGPPDGRMPPFPVLMALDADNDGEISADEIKNAVAALKKLDRNNDGKLDREEMRPQFGGRGGEGRGFGRPDGPPPGGPEGGRGFGGGNFVDGILERDDANKDGKLTGDEIPERMRERIADIDTNDDGAVNRAELEAMARRFMDRGGEGGRGPRDGGAREGDRGPRDGDRGGRRPEGEDGGRRRPEAE
ncbi:MAG: hypothetical protein KDA89_08025 [Planctomycetaceae bacterium]|nr:hypothetical protein [Planctomycetaceae bacterium]